MKECSLSWENDSKPGKVCLQTKSFYTLWHWGIILIGYLYVLESPIHHKKYKMDMITCFL